MGNFGIKMELSSEEQSILTSLDAELQPSSITFHRKLSRIEMHTMGEILIDLKNRTNDEDNHINFALGDWMIKTQEWFGATPAYKEEKTEEKETQSKVDILHLDDEVIRYLQKHPNEMYSLNPRLFGELVAAILKDLGYSVELTARGADGGVDILATQKAGIGELLVIVDCKRYAPDRRVGVGIVRSLYGIGEKVRATMAILATTSFFTQPAIEFQSEVRNRMSLRDYNDLICWLNNYGKSSIHPKG